MGIIHPRHMFKDPWGWESRPQDFKSRLQLYQNQLRQMGNAKHDSPGFEPGPADIPFIENMVDEAMDKLLDRMPEIVVREILRTFRWLRHGQTVQYQMANPPPAYDDTASEHSSSNDSVFDADTGRVPLSREASDQ